MSSSLQAIEFKISITPFPQLVWEKLCIRSNLRLFLQKRKIFLMKTDSNCNSMLNSKFFLLHSCPNVFILLTRAVRPAYYDFQSFYVLDTILHNLLKVHVGRHSLRRWIVTEKTQMVLEKVVTLFRFILYEIYKMAFASFIFCTPPFLWSDIDLRSDFEWCWPVAPDCAAEVREVLKKNISNFKIIFRMNSVVHPIVKSHDPLFYW